VTEYATLAGSDLSRKMLLHRSFDNIV